jgi:hypothetical protein
MKKVGVFVTSFVFLLCGGLFGPNANAQSEAASQGDTKNGTEKNLYFVVKTATSRMLYAAEHYQLGGTSPTSTEDASKLNLMVVTKSHILGSDEKIPLKDVHTFYYDGSRSRDNPIGDFKVTTFSNSATLDSSYQNPWPIKHFIDEKQWVPLTEISGTAYNIPYNATPSIIQNASLSLSVSNLDRTTVTMVTTDVARKMIDIIMSKIADANRVQDKKKEELAAKKQQEAAEIQANITQMSKEARGSEDSCKRIMTQQYVITIDPDSAPIKCQFGGFVSTDVLAQAGWLIVNKTRGKDGVVTDYYIRKAR